MTGMAIFEEKIQGRVLVEVYCSGGVGLVVAMNA